jgi:hypothetical protein
MTRGFLALALLLGFALAACDTDLNRPKKDQQATEAENSEGGSEGSGSSY